LSVPASLKHPLGLALGGGGARGLAHIGVLKVLEREGIATASIAGTSMGGLIGAAYAAGLSAREIEAEALRLTTVNAFVKLIDWKPHRGSLVTGDRIHDYLSEKLGKGLRFSELSKDLALVAADMHTGQQVVLRSGSVVDAMRATMSVSGVFSPLEREAFRLADGGAVNNVPADVVRDMNVKSVVAVDVMPDFSRNIPGEPPVVTGFVPRGLPSVARDLWQTMLLMVSAMTARTLEDAQPDLVVRPTIPNGVTIFRGFSQAEAIIAAGEAATEAALGLR